MVAISSIGHCRKNLRDNDKNIMKRILVTFALAGIATLCSGQSRNGSSEMRALETASLLARYGYENYSAEALMEAARIFAETPTRKSSLAEIGTIYPDTTELYLDHRICLDPQRLLSDAKKFALRDELLLAMASRVEESLERSQSRGSSSGPEHLKAKVYGNSSKTIILEFVKGEIAEVSIAGDGSCDLDLFVYDENGYLVASDDGYEDICIVRWIPAWTGPFSVRVVNRGELMSTFDMWTN